MNNYEIMFIVRSTLDEATVKAISNSMKDVLTSKKAKIVEEKEMGQRELAYEIDKQKNGYYFLFKVEANSEAINEFSRVANVNENIIRYITLNLDK